MNYKTIFIAVTILLFAININAQEQKEITLDSFNEVKFEGSAHWVLIPSDMEQVIIESKTEDVFDYIDIDQNGNLLTISTTDKNKNITKLFKSVTIKVYFKSLNSVSLSGIGSVKTTGEITVSELIATLRGTGNMHIYVKCSTFTGNMFGTGSLYLKGSTNKAVINVEGVGNFDGYEFITADTEIKVSGIGGATVHATDRLKATINGVGSIRFKGDPKTKNLKTNGLGNIKRFQD